MIAPMDRVEIVFLRSELKQMVAFLQEQGMVQVETVPLTLDSHPSYLDRVHLPEAEQAELAALESLETLLTEAVPLLSVKPGHAEISAAAAALVPDRDAPPAQWEEDIQTWHKELRSLSRAKVEAQDKIEVLRNYAAMLGILAPLLVEQGGVLGETARAMVLDGYGADDLERLEARLADQMGIEYKLTHRRLGRAATSVGLGRNSLIAVVSYPAGKDEGIQAFLQAEGIAAVNAPDDAAHGISVDEATQKINAKIASLEGDVAKGAEEVERYSKAAGPAMTALQGLLRDRITQLQVVRKFAQSRLVMAAHGWIPREKCDELCSAVESVFGARAAIERATGEGVDLHRFPTLLVNHPIVKPFERIMSVLKPPVYGTYDPTMLVGFSFVLFYGFVLGDAGYGLILFALGAWVKSKWGHIAPLHDGMTILQWMAGSSIVFGLIYFEIFGNLAEHLTGWHALFHRAKEVELLLGLAILFGAVHIPLSLIIGIREGYRHGHLKHAREKLAMLLSLAALAVALMGGTGVLPVSAGMAYGGAALIFAVALINFARGMGAMAPMGVMEIVSLCANILSYSRLMALGIASIAFADIANMLPEMMGGGLVGALVGIPLAVGVHAFNIGLGVFSPALHSLRLNVVEFMPKFYEPGGTLYKPFRKELAW